MIDKSIFVYTHSDKKLTFQLYLTIVVCICILYYVVFKASHTSFTHDESYTYTHYVHQSFMDIISYKTPYTNNHILNTLLTKYSEVVFGNSEISLRLPNILGFIIYSIFSILLLRKFVPQLVLPGYLLITLNPHLLDFFALSRGYGLSFAFLVMSVYYLCSYFIYKKNKHLILFNIGAFLAVMSNFSLLNYYVASLITYNIVSYIISKTNSSNNTFDFFVINKINIVSIIITGAVLYEPLRRISKMNLLDFGGKNSFMKDTVGTAIYSFFYDMYMSPFYETLLKAIILGVVALSIVFIIQNILKKHQSFFITHIPLILINLILIAIVIITIMQHVLLGNDYYVHRFALFFYPLFVLNVIFLLNYFLLSYKVVITSICYLCSVLVVFNIYINHNWVYYKDWKVDHGLKEMMRKMVLEHEKNPNKQIRLGINWLFEPSVNFYRYTWDLKWLNPAHRRGVSKYDDYFYILNNDKEFKLLSNKNVIYKDSLSGAVLIKNNTK